jgi:hypothetical protein
VADTRSFAWLVLVIAVSRSRRSTVESAIIVKGVPDLHAPAEQTVERLVTVALVCVLFDGGMHVGRARFRSAAETFGFTELWPADGHRARLAFGNSRCH